MPYVYKNTSDKELMIPNVGVVKAGGEIPSEYPLANRFLNLISDSPTPSKEVKAVDSTAKIETKDGGGEGK